ncbi:dihydrofolate reductase family protein [Edaphocola aurantiacus]|uniref:dihydrofolate reductase family protein n=1 Tax=Edaphocola aurantiacus TaxID=2601682 RepID=UPI001C978AF9|nr:dihydrofolate reductase family protein [Edaphocola aurantiacus]
MRKVIAAFNITLDGFCDHTAVTPDEEIHQYYADLLRDGDTILYGRVTYQLMEYWRALEANPSGTKAMDDFALVMNNINKIVFSRTLKSLDWSSAQLATRSLEEEVLQLRQQPGKDILVGSRSLIISLMNLGLIDELRLMIHPVIAGGGLPLFDHIQGRTELQLVNTQIFNAGAVMNCYKPA